MEYNISKKPKSPTIIEGFPGFGLVGTIATGFLIDHLNAKSIGSITSKDIVPMATIHGQKIIRPLEIFYDSRHNIIIVNALTNVQGLEWDLAKILTKMAKNLNAKEVISIEGVSTPGLTSKKVNAYYYSNKNQKKFEKISIPPIKDGIVMGVTAALLLETDKTPFSSIFVETHTGLPDSKAAAKIVEVIDKYLGLKVDYKPLIKKAEQFEVKLKELVERSKSAEKIQKEKEVPYVG